MSAVYRKVRPTDPEPINHIAQESAGHSSVRAADIGCGAGRYGLLSFIARAFRGGLLKPGSFLQRGLSLSFPGFVLALVFSVVGLAFYWVLVVGSMAMQRPPD